MSPDTLFRDPLTGAYSRAALQERFREEVQRAWRYKLDLSLILLDLDYFKSINDAFGHTRGDQVLCEFVQRLNSLVRESDLLFRYGGDEFVLLLPHTSKAQAHALAVRLLDGVRAEPFGGKPPIVLAMSIGVASFPDDAHTPEALFEKADVRHYEAKRSGRGRVVAEDPARSDDLVFHASSRLVERDKVLQNVHRFLDALPEQRRGLMVVSGVRGSGRSSFLAEVAKSARLRGYTLLTLKGSPALRVRAHGALSEALRNWDGMPPVTEGRDKLIQAFRLLLEDKESAGLLVAADDLSELDQATLDFLRALFAAPEIPILAVAYATERQAARQTFHLDAPLVETVVLDPLSREGTHVWLRSVLQWEPPESFTDWFYHELGGFPALLQASLTLLVEKGLLRKEEGGWSLSPQYTEIKLGEKLRLHTSAVPHNLPVVPTSFVGREGEIQDVKQLIEERRLVTILGPGGVGKTRLALQAASEMLEMFPDGAWFVPLAPVTSPEFIVSTVADALRLTFGSTDDPLSQLLEYLQDKSLLLIMDNFEHLIEGAPLLSEILQAAPQVRILATSRERLHLQEEWLLELEGLRLPRSESEAEALNSGAVQLFVERARGVHPHFNLSEVGTVPVARICRIARGMPLGIELAAAWARVLSCDEIAAGIEENLDFLVTHRPDIPDRHRSLRGAFEYSWTLLSEEERRVFRKLSVFRGGFRREAADQVAGASLLLLSALIDKSLLRRTSSMRYEIHDLLRQYAAEKLLEHADESREVRSRHCAYYADFLARREEPLSGKKQKEALEQIGEELENLRAGWNWAVTHEPEELVQTYVEPFYRFHMIRSLFTEAEAALALGAQELRRRHVTGYALGKVLSRLGLTYARLGQYGKCKELAQESLEIARNYGQQADLPFYLNGLANACHHLRELEEAKRLYEESLAVSRRVAGDRYQVARALNNLGLVVYDLGQHQEARRLYEESLAMMKEIGNQFGTVIALANLGELACAAGEYAESRRYFHEGLQGAMELQAVFVALDLLIGEAALLAVEGKQETAVFMLAFVLGHPAIEKEYKDKAESLFARLSTEVPSEAIARARAAARVVRLEDVVAEVLINP